MNINISVMLWSYLIHLCLTNLALTDSLYANRLFENAVDAVI